MRVGSKPVAFAPPIHKPPIPIRLDLNAAFTGTNRFLVSVTIMTSRQAKLQEDTHFRVMRILQENPDLTQRELAERVGVSVGGLNYCLKALMEKGLVKMKNFSNSKNKFGYVYVLTPRGMAEKAAITHRFLQRKVEEYEALKAEIQALQSEVGKTGGAGAQES
jgi:EPS-associated MarR family transcriptional regulator